MRVHLQGEQALLHAVLADETIDLHLPLLAETMDPAERGSEGRGVLGSEEKGSEDRGQRVKG